MCMSTQKEEHHRAEMWIQQIHNAGRDRDRRDLRGGGRGKVYTVGEKINVICLSHHAFPKYTSAFLSPRQKLSWGSCCPPPPALCSPNRTSLQSSTVYINVSHSSCIDFRTVHNFNKRKLLLCSACSGNNRHTRTSIGMVGGRRRGGWGLLLTLKEMATDLDRQSACPQKDDCCH